MANLTKKLNALLSKSGLLLKEFNSNDGDLINTLYEAVNTNYVFTPTQITKFISQACKPQWAASFLGSTIDKHKTIITYIFKNCYIPESDIIKACSQRFIRANKINYFIDILFEKKYNFTCDGMQQLIESGYKNFQLNNYDVMHNNIVLIAISCMTSMPLYGHIFNKSLEFIIKDTEPFNIIYFETLCKLLNTCIHQISFYDKKSEIIRLFMALCTKCTDGEPLFQMVNDRNIMFRMLCDMLIDRFGYSDNFVKYLVSVHGPEEYILKMAHNGYKITVDDINKMLTWKNTFILKDTTKYTSLPFHSVVQSRRLIDETHVNTFDLFKYYNLQPNMETLSIVCKQGYYELTNTIIEEYNVIPDKNTLDSCITSMNYDLITKILKYKLIPDDNTFYQINLCNMYNYHTIAVQIIELLISNGLVITMDHISYLCSQKLSLDDLSRFGINYDNKLYFACYMHNFFPDEYITKCNIDPTLVQLYTLCKSNKTSYANVIDFLINNNITLNRYALDILIQWNLRIGTKIMDTYGCIPSIITAFRHCNLPFKLLNEVIKKYNINEDDMLEPYDLVIK